MSSPASTTESSGNFPDLKSHQQMYSSYTHLITRGIIGVVVLLVVLGFITGIL